MSSTICYSGANGTSHSDMRLSTVPALSSSFVHITPSYTSNNSTTPLVYNTTRTSLVHSSLSLSTDSQSHFTITSTTISSFTTLTVSSKSHSNIQTSSLSVVSTNLLFTTINNITSNVSSTGPYRSSVVTTLQVLALVLTGLVILVALVIVVLTLRYCNYGNNLQPQNLKRKLFTSNGHRGFSKVRTFDPDASDDELTIFTKF